MCVYGKQINQKFDVRSCSFRKCALLTQIGSIKGDVDNSYYNNYG